MEKKEVKSVLILIFLILLFILFFFGYTLLQVIENDQENIQIQNTENNQNSVEIDKIEKNPIRDIIQKYGSKYLKEEGPSIYVEFAKNLYDQKGNSNRNYFQKIIDDLVPYYEKESFYLIDNPQEIYIHIKYDMEKDEHIIIINEVEDFFNKTEGEDYVLVDESKIVPRSSFMIMDTYLLTLAVRDFYFDAISDKIGEGTDLGNGYTSYLDGTMELRTIPTGGVRNIVYTKDYEGMITTEISSRMSLKKIKEIEPNNSFGGLSEDYLGYREDNFYVFFYDNELSFYPYSYKNNKTFEAILKDYLDNRNLESFVNNLRSRWMAYDHLEYDPETNSADILYSTRGIHIQIQNNETRGIRLYSNYYFTDYTKKLVKQGIIDFEPGVDLVEKTELERRKSN